MTLSSDNDRQLTGVDMTSMAGSLLVSAAARDTGPFERFISSLLDRLTKVPDPDGDPAP